MGGLLALRLHAGRRRAGPPRALVARPERQPAGWQHGIEPIAAGVVHASRSSTRGGRALSRDPEVGRRAVADPGSPRRDRARRSPSERARIASAPACSRYRLPVRSSSAGGGDVLVPPEASEPLEELPGGPGGSTPVFAACSTNHEGTELVADAVAVTRPYRVR